MQQLNHTYAGTLTQVLNASFPDPPPVSLITRLHDLGIYFSGAEITGRDGCEIGDLLVLECVCEFVAASAKANLSTPRNGEVELDLKQLCEKIAARRAEAESPLGPTDAVDAAASPSAAEAGDESPVAGAPTTPAAEVAVPGDNPSLAATATAPSTVTPESPAPPATRKPATWQNNPAVGPWCPEVIQPHLGFEVAYQDNYESEADASPGWHIVAATHRGRMHAHHATHREDAFLFHPDKDFTIVCVSDGAGAYQHSRIGSESTCRKVVSVLAEALISRRAELAKLTPKEFNVQLQTLIGAAVQAACDFLTDLAEKTETKLKDFRCTLVLGVLWLAGETPLLVFSQVGDGFMSAQGKDGQARRYGESDSGAFSGEVNCFMPDACAVGNAQNLVPLDAANADAFIFCSDGIEDPFYPTEKKSQVIFQQLRDGVSAPIAGFEKQKTHGPVIGSSDAKARLAAWLDFEKKGENDDRTILILHRTPSQLSVSAKAAKVEASAETPAAVESPAAAKPE